MKSEEQPDEITVRVAQLWCQPEHANKEMDPDLACSIVGLVKAILNDKERELAANDKLLKEMAVKHDECAAELKEVKDELAKRKLTIDQDKHDLHNSALRAKRLLSAAGEREKAMREALAAEDALENFSCPHDAEHRCQCAKAENELIIRCNKLRRIALALPRSHACEVAEWKDRVVEACRAYMTSGDNEDLSQPVWDALAAEPKEDGR